MLYTLSELGGLGARELGGFAALVQLLLAGLIGAALTADTVDLFVWFEVAALASYGLTGFFLERPPALEAAFKILVLTTIAGFCVFIAAGLLYNTQGALNYGQLATALAKPLRTADLLALGLFYRGLRHQGRAGPVPRLARPTPTPPRRVRCPRCSPGSWSTSDLSGIARVSLADLRAARPHPGPRRGSGHRASPRRY